MSAEAKQHIKQDAKTMGRDDADLAVSNETATIADDVAAVSAALQRLTTLRGKARRSARGLENGPHDEANRQSPAQASDAASMLHEMGRTAYHWDYRSDRLRWASNADQTLPRLAPASVSTGESYERLVDPQHARARRLAILEARDRAGNGPSEYRVQYRLFPSGPNPDEAIWIEEEGVWNALPHQDATRPEARRTTVTALLRVINQPAIIEEELHYLSRYDEMTGQLNRSYFTKLLAALLSEKQNGSAPQSALLLVGISNLHMINESFGYHVGDEMIIAVGHRLRENLRRGDLIGRYGSNKFAILLHDCETTGMESSARRLINAIEQDTFKTSAGYISGKICIGGVAIDNNLLTVEQITGRALDALDQANARPLDSFVIYEPSLQRDNLRRKNNSIAAEVTEALTTGRVQFAMQPIVSADHLQPSHYECLVRLERDGGQIVPASQFMPVAEKMGFARPIDRRVLDLVLDYARHRPEMKLAFNVSGLTTLDYGWLDTLERGIGHNRELASRLMVEITETSVLTDINDTIAFVKAVKALGCRVAIDDFGAGYTSFRNLKMLDVDMVKIDSSFIKELYQNTDDQLFVRTMISLAFNLGIETVAEGVRDQRTAELLRSMGVTYLQGYYFGRPKLVTPYCDFTETEMEQTSPLITKTPVAANTAQPLSIDYTTSDDPGFENPQAEPSLMPSQQRYPHY